jgi:cytochrome c2
MADKVASEQLEKRVETAAPDPIADRSMSVPLLVCSLLLIGTLIWSLYDEVLGQRPWKSYQREFVDNYSGYLQKVKKPQAAKEKEVKESPEYQQLDQAVKDAEQEAGPRLKEIRAEVGKIDQKIADITPKFQDTRAWIAAKTYLLETATSESQRKSIRDEIEAKKKEPETIELHQDGGSVKEEKLDFYQMEDKYNKFRDEKAKLIAEQIALGKPAEEARKKRDEFVQDRLVGLTEQQIGQLIKKTENFDFSIKQINIGGIVVDRCESCHLGVREPVTLKRENIGDPAFVSHPQKDLLKIHDPDKFGCSTCHGGNGRGTTSVEKGHGRYKHWLWPLYYKENVQAGCNQCHNRDRVTSMADTLNRGKDLFQNKGCVGCHRYEGFDREGDGLSSTRQTIKQLEMDKTARTREVEQTRAAADQAESDEEARNLLHRVDSLRQMISELDARIDQFEIQSKYLMKDQKKVGPNLKEIKAKLRKEWIPVWLQDPQAFRPGTKMPTFRLDDEEIRAISAFLWQSSLDMKAPGQPQGDLNRGRELFKATGCMACHSIDGRAINMGDQTVGGHFAANLSRVGEKANYDYIVRWVHNPRERLAPYSPSLRRDLTPQDYTQKNLSFVFDDDHSRSPVDGRELQVQNMTVMPNFRLSDQDARDIASFLMNWKRADSGYRDPQYPDASYLDDSNLKARGEELVKLYGCAGCHEIRGLEEEQKIGTELTLEGSKPIERLDFALLTEDAMRGQDPITNKELDRSWYNHKGFFEYKLRNPAIYDRGKEKPAKERLRMPNIYLEEDDITALTTFLLGSVTTSFPEPIRYNATGQRKDVQNGWWVVQKYNCMGCHNVLIGQDSILMGLPMYQDADGKEQLPPRLTSEGSRVNPEWLLKFLNDPSLRPPGGGQESGARGQGSRLMEHLTGGAGPSTAMPSRPLEGAPPQPPSSTRPPTPDPRSPAAALRPQPGLNRNGVRQYLRVRMPTFNFSPNELQTLVNFFMGANSQQQPYIPEKLDPLTTEEQNLARALFTSAAAPCLKCHMTGEAAHDSRATAPNFLIAPERLKPAWTERWLVDPSLIAPGTSMPSGLFTRDESKNRWVFAGPTPPTFQNYEKDHVALLVRYMFQINQEEQRRLLAGGGGAAAPTAAPAAAPSGSPSAAANRPRRAVARGPGKKSRRQTGP